MGQEAIIFIESENLREIKSIVNKFCIDESGKGVSFSFHLQSFGKKSHILVFSQAIPFDLFCELLFSLDVLSEDKRKVRAYLNVRKEGSGLPEGCMVYVNDIDKSDFAAVDSRGNLYEDDAEAEPYLFKPTGKTACYVPFPKPKSAKCGRGVYFPCHGRKDRLVKTYFQQGADNCRQTPFVHRRVSADNYHAHWFYIQCIIGPSHRK